MDSSVKEQALGLVNQINNRCQVEVEGLTFEDLATKDWYLHILARLCDYLGDKLTEIENETNEATAINQILKLINQLDQFAEDVTEQIDGDAVAAGNPEQIFYMVQVIAALVDAAQKQNQQGEQVSDGNEEEDEEGGSKISAPKMEKLVQKSIQKEKRSHSYQNKLNRSAQEIGNDFEEQSNSSQQMMVQYRLKDSNYPQMVQSIPNAEFSIDESPPKEKVMPFTHEKDVEYSDINDQSPQYLDQKMSETKMVKKKRNVPNKSLKKNPERNELIYGNKNPKKLISHPKTPQTLKKAKSQEQIQMTRKMQQQIRKTNKKKLNSKNSDLKRARSPVDDQLRKKGKQIRYFMNERATQKKQNIALKKKQKSHAQKNQRHLMKMLNWRDQQMKRERQQYEQSIKMKVQLQKQTYVKQINDLIIKLEKQKEIQQKKDFKQNLVKQNEQAVRRMSALEQWYKNKINLIKQNRKEKRKERYMIRTGHKEIIGQIQKQLKKENDEKLMKLTMRYRSEQQNIQNDLQQLTAKIIKVYKKN